MHGLSRPRYFAPTTHRGSSIRCRPRRMRKPTLERIASGDASEGSLLRADDVAELLGVPTSWVYEQSRLGRIPTVTLGRYRRYRRDAIEQWLEALETPHAG